MDTLEIPTAAIVGWSDGVITGLHIAIHHADRVAKLFAFGINFDPSGLAQPFAAIPYFGSPAKMRLRVSN